MYWAVQNTLSKHLLRIVLRIKCFEINFFPKFLKIRFINFKIVFFKMQFFYSQFPNTLTQPFLHFLIYFFLKCWSNNRLQHTSISQNSHLPTHSPFSWNASHLLVFIVRHSRMMWIDKNRISGDASSEGNRLKSVSFRNLKRIRLLEHKKNIYT